MPSRATKTKPKGRKSRKRPMEKPDPLRRQLHDLANSLEAISLAGHFITRKPKVVPLLETIAGAVRDTRRILQQMDANLRDTHKTTPGTRRHAISR
jgi:hypothetical protein